MPTFLPMSSLRWLEGRLGSVGRKASRNLWLRRYFLNGLQFQKKASGIHSQPVGSAPCGLSRAFG